MNQKKFYVICFLVFMLNSFGQEIKVKSPDNNLQVTVNLGDKITYSVLKNGKIVLKDNSISLQLQDRVLGENPKLKKKKTSEVSELITPVIPMKFSSISNNYKMLLLAFKDNYSVEFRVFNEGIAYRFITNLKGSIQIKKENFTVNLPENYTAHLQQTPWFKTSYEYPYTHLETSNFKAGLNKSTLPVLLENDTFKILLSESDVTDYPAMFINVENPNQLHGEFPLNPLEFEDNGDRSVKITKHADYIAQTTGKRSMPWRYFLVTSKDSDLLTNTLTVKLAQPNVLNETAWIKPGQVSWEWWNGASPYHVDFVAGYNEDTYKYFIDFASEFGIPYIIMDEGWAKSTTDPYTPNPDIDLFELIKYGKERNVEIVLWLTWLTVEHNFELFKTFHEWGISGVKIDFMDRSDQWMVNFYERVAKEAAKNEIFVDFHGAFKPAGLEIKYPNILTYEGVLGLEQMGRAVPDNSVYLPFIRNAVGPMDFTPGAMINMQPEIYYSERPNSAGVGTRANQMALFVIFESGLQMLADNPTNYYREKECTEFITSVPVTWDETVVLDAKIGEYVIVAKRRDDQWFIGGIANGKEPVREFTVSLDFLKKGTKYKLTSFEDGINAQRQAMDYKKKETEIESSQKISIKMVKNGGFAAIINPYQ
ncbi:glycoside hydrolase family 97 protein [Polaribacter vadi]|uniref:glycoside hydrolase family 97 protein n=1 Tax=Polaribacter vadi TaxID=1774273 RepID=UPI0030EB204C|tara:strand:- start:36325 stop:38274 length:1950 start_codon:yes stop_codon:yes gene_type:complete